ncbi:hypothetical protein WMY93_021454 [Mugilogobius chulae]|uniref:Uncharacterized protein n=1 Tax=Mugilogobius chulae TaxID=88201 RepID=A0AAW0NFE0_9GOBI
MLSPLFFSSVAAEIGAGCRQRQCRESTRSRRYTDPGGNTHALGETGQHMDPGVLIFLLYVMIAHELVCGWMQYRKQNGRARARTGPPPRSRARMCPGVWRASSQSQRSDRAKELRKSGRIVRKA